MPNFLQKITIHGEKKYDSYIGKKLINCLQGSPDSGLTRQKLQISFKYAQRANENHENNAKERLSIEIIKRNQIETS